LLHLALEQWPADNQLLRLVARQRKLAERFARVNSLLEETLEALADDTFVRAVGAFREAANLSRGIAVLEEASFELAVDQAKELGCRNWRIAGTLLEEASRIDCKAAILGELWEQVRAAERAETIGNVLAETALAKPEDLDRARERLIKTLSQYPDDSGLATRLKSIESTIEEKRKWDDRQKQLKELAKVREALQREADPVAAGKYVPLSEGVAGAYIADTDFANILEDIKQQVISSERAVVALQQDRIDDCLEECAWVLSRMRHHRVFLQLKAQAEERELVLVDEYSNTVARVRELLDAEDLVEAERLCSEACAKLPQFTEFKELAKEIAQRKDEKSRHLGEHIEGARRLVERGERSLRERHIRAAEPFFSNALKLLPGDKNLAEQIIGILHGCARSVVRENAEATKEVLAIAQRLFPGTAVPTDLTEALRQKKEQSKIAAERWLLLSKIGDLEGRVDAAKTRDQLLALESEAANGNFVFSSLTDVKEAAHVLFDKIDGKRAKLDQKLGWRPAVLRGIALAAALLLTAGVAYWWNKTQSPLAPVESVIIEPPVPAKAAVAQAPARATLEIHAVISGLQIKLDGVLLRIPKKKKVLRRSLPAGDHLIELSRSGFLSKAMERHFEAGQVLTLAGRDLQLESSDGRTLASEQQTWKQLAKSGSLADVKSFLARYPKGANAAAAFAKVEELEWRSVDQKNPDSLRAYVTEYPASRFSSQARQEMEAILAARAANAEESGWSSAEHGNKALLEDFLRKYPRSRHAPAALSAMAEIDRKTRAAEKENLEEATWKKVNLHDQASLESYLSSMPTGRYRVQAEAALASLREASRPQPKNEVNSEIAAVLMVLSRLASAWSTKDLDSILAIQRNLNKRAVKAELAHVKELEMRISPASPPQIEGSQAVVLCRREASQLFSDGTRKRIPASFVSYVLEKRDGNWTIEGTR